MGLDVYLYHFDAHYAKFRAARAQLREELAARLKAEAPYPPRDADEAVRDAAHERQNVIERAFIAERLNPLRAAYGLAPVAIPSYGLYECWSDDERQIDRPSVLHPECSCRIGYWRSAYNAGGFNAVLHELTGKTLLDIFPEACYEFVPDWRAARGRAAALLEELRAAAPCGYRVVEFPPPDTRPEPPPEHVYTTGDFPPDVVIAPRAQIDSRYAALRDFLQEKATNEARPHPLAAYDSGRGSFWFEYRPRVAGILYGAGSDKNAARGIEMDDKTAGRPAMYLVVESAGDNADCIERLEVVQETIDWVLQQPIPEDYWLKWSG